jgi:alpha-galactosidase
VLRDLWSHRVAETAGTVSGVVPPHGTAMYRVKADARDWARRPPSAAFGIDLSTGRTGIPGSVTPAGRPFTVKVRATDNGRLPIWNPRVRLDAPAGWRAEPLGPTGTPLLRTGQTLTAAWRVTPPASTPARGGYRLTARFSDGESVTEDLLVPKPVPGGTSGLGDLEWATMTNGYGPVERNMSNGGAPPGDGKPLAINGTVYPQGLGTHARAELLYYLGGRCSSLGVDVGVDDSKDPRPLPGQSTVTFEIWADGTKVADSGLRTWRDGPLHLTGGLTEASFLRIVTTDAGDGNSYDRGDWAAPVLTCGGAR